MSLWCRDGQRCCNVAKDTWGETKLPADRKYPPRGSPTPGVHGALRGAGGAQFLPGPWPRKRNFTTMRPELETKRCHRRIRRGQKPLTPEPRVKFRRNAPLFAKLRFSLRCWVHLRSYSQPGGWEDCTKTGHKNIMLIYDDNV